MCTNGDLEKAIRQVVVRGTVVLSSGQESSWYADTRLLTMHRRWAFEIGSALHSLTGALHFTAAGGMSTGAYPVGMAMLATAPDCSSLNAIFTVRKTPKAHGTRKVIEGPGIAGQDVLIVDDVVTSGGSALAAVGAARRAGANVVGVAAILDRGGSQRIRENGLWFGALFSQDFFDEVD